MSDQPDLNNLSIKDLRQLAGEHQIQNRSRLSKDDLIHALQGVLTGHLAATSAKAAKAAAEKAAAANANEETGIKAPSVENKEQEPAEQAATEPELLDAAAVAELTSNNATEDSDDFEDDDAEDGSDEADSTTEGDADDRPRRRRRRRRGRGRGRRDGPAPLADGTTRTEEAVQNNSAEKIADTPVAATAEKTAALPEKAPVAATPAVRPVVPPRAAPQPSRPATPNHQAVADQRAPRPRLEGPQRPLPSVLDRLCSFSKGILELCDPSTPSWAQARLSELLAEIGVGPCPAQGAPHPEFHQVVGTIVAKNIPHGHIALVEAPGFIMRGDRGDLFSLRKAVVRVAGNERSDVVPAALATAIAPPPRTAAPATSVSSPNHVPVQNNGTSAQAPSPSPSAPPEARRPAQAVPDRGRSPLKTHGMEPVGEAPRLPLAQQDPVALAAREKSMGFSKLGLNEQILADLAAIGYNEPSPIQEQSIPVILSGKDILGQAQTGTGKTAAFVLPILQKLYSIESPERKPVALMLCPTRELARQVYNEFNRMAGASGARATVIYGGTPMDDQVRALESFPHVIIGTPGRIIDHMKRRTLDLSGLQTLVLDEADQMLDIGFWPDVNYIMGHTPPARQVLLFSATFPEEVKEMAQKHMKEPESVRITPKVITVEQVDQKYIPVARERKNALLAHFIETQNPPQLVVFCRTKHQTDRVAEVLKRKNMSAGAIHGDLPQTKRERILAAFRSGEIQSLIATNVAARGLDIPTVSHVVNYDIPEMPEEYVHRIGRTARNGAKGIARTFITPEDGQFLLEIEKHIGLLLEEEKVEGFEATPAEPEVKRTIAEMPVGQPRILKPLVGGIRLGRRRR